MFTGCRPKVPIVLYTWLDECIDQRTMVPLGKHLIGETGASLQTNRIIAAQSCHYDTRNTDSVKNGSELRNGDANISFESAKFPRATVSYGNNESNQISKRIKVAQSQNPINSLLDADLTLPEICIKETMTEALINPWAKRDEKKISNSDGIHQNMTRNFPIEQIKNSDLVVEKAQEFDITSVLQFDIFSGKYFSSSGFSKKQVRLIRLNIDEYY